jgi:hypothetical protein
MDAKTLDRVHHPALTDLVVAARKTLTEAKSCAAILDAQAKAQVAINAARRAARFAKAQGAHEDLVDAARRLMGDARGIEAAADVRLAVEYDAAQDRGELPKAGKPNSSRAEELGAVEGLTHKQIYEARIIRAGEEAEPGVVQKTIFQLLEEGHEPTRVAVRKACIEAATKALKGGGGGHRSKRNPHYKPNPLRDALLAVTGACDEIVRKVADHPISKIVRAFSDDAERDRAAIKIDKAIRALQLIQREIAT